MKTLFWRLFHSYSLEIGDFTTGKFYYCIEENNSYKPFCISTGNVKHDHFSFQYHISCSFIKHVIQIYSRITSGRVFDGELLYTEIPEVNLFAFAYRPFS